MTLIAIYIKTDVTKSTLPYIVRFGGMGGMIENSEFSYYPINPLNGTVRCLMNWVYLGEFGVFLHFCHGDLSKHTKGKNVNVLHYRNGQALTCC